MVEQKQVELGPVRTTIMEADFLTTPLAPAELNRWMFLTFLWVMMAGEPLPLTLVVTSSLLVM